MSNLIDRVVITTVLGIVAIIILFMLFVWTPHHLYRIDHARDWAKQNGCEYLGTTRDLPEIMFFDCNGVISAKRFEMQSK